MQTWVAACLLIGQGIFLLVAVRILKAFGVYVDVLLATQAKNIDIRRNMALQENDRAALDVLHHRRRDDPPLTEREA